MASSLMEKYSQATEQVKRMDRRKASILTFNNLHSFVTSSFLIAQRS
jgi:hypothetical protein